MTRVRCNVCFGSGSVMGSGMLMKDCDECDGVGKINRVEDEIGFLEIKKSEQYQKAKESLIEKHDDLSSDQAEKLLDDALKPKRGRPRKEAL